MSALSTLEKNNNIIEAKNVGKEFNGVWVLRNIDFDLRSGEIHSLVGENGAGKSTFIKILSGIYSPSEGSITVDGTPAVFKNVKESEAHGIRTVHQEINLVPFFNVYENVFLGSENNSKTMGLPLVDKGKMKRETIKVLKDLGIEFDVSKPAHLLNASMERIVEICKVLVHKPKVIVFDEPTTSLGESERLRLLEVIKGLKKKGIGIIYISHNLEEVLAISDRITVFRDGSKISTIDRKDATTEKIIKMMLGNKTYSDYTRKQSYRADEVYLEVNHLFTDKLRDVSFKLYKGEILGIAGVVGAGKSEIANALFGIDRIHKGSIKVYDKELSPTPQKAVSCGMAYVPEERQAQGLILNYCVMKNITLTYLKKWCKWSVINKQEEKKITEQYIGTLSIKTTGPNQLIKLLSGGNQQKVILARWLDGDFNIGIFDEPTKGIDIKAKEDIYLILDKLAQQGKSSLVLSSYLPELLGICDRILVIRDGRIVKEFISKEEKMQEKIMAAMLGG
ncbi:MAG: sugar ABC transporter ATP-binding protein [Clostridia bacterium]|nr:sugar ABC transporter ATP-binding protein [Clostridia bacterium]